MTECARCATCVVKWTETEIFFIATEVALHEETYRNASGSAICSPSDVDRSTSLELGRSEDGKSESYEGEQDAVTRPYWIIVLLRLPCFDCHRNLQSQTIELLWGVLLEEDLSICCLSQVSAICRTAWACGALNRRQICPFGTLNMRCPVSSTAPNAMFSDHSAIAISIIVNGTSRWMLTNTPWILDPVTVGSMGTKPPVFFSFFESKYNRMSTTDWVLKIDSLALFDSFWSFLADSSSTCWPKLVMAIHVRSWSVSISHALLCPFSHLESAFGLRSLSTCSKLIRWFFVWTWFERKRLGKLCYRSVFIFLSAMISESPVYTNVFSYCSDPFSFLFFFRACLIMDQVLFGSFAFEGHTDGIVFASACKPARLATVAIVGLTLNASWCCLLGFNLFCCFELLALLRRIRIVGHLEGLSQW